MDERKNSNTVDVSDMFIVTPMGQKINLTPGERYTGEILVANPAAAKQNFEYHVSVTPYSIKDDEYGEDFDEASEWSELVNWITIDNPSGSIQPNETAHVTFSIDVPEDARPGGQYVALTVGSKATGGGEDGVNVSNIYEMASIIYAKVSGEIKREGKILENSFPGFVLNLPFEATVKVQNDGNIHEIAKVTVLVKDLISGQEIYAEKDEDNTINDVVMPETTKTIPREVTGINPLGVYEVTQTVDYMGQYSVETHQVIACPLWFLLVVAALLIAMIGGIIAFLRRHRKKKQRLQY